MNDIKPLVCPQCGGPINRSKNICEYCGTQFKNDEYGPVRMEIIRPGVKVIQSQRILTDEMIMYMGSKEASEYVLKQMAEEMAEHLIPMMDVQTCKEEEDIFRRETRIRARLRVVEPTYTF